MCGRLFSDRNPLFRNMLLKSGFAGHVQTSNPKGLCKRYLLLMQYGHAWPYT